MSFAVLAILFAVVAAAARACLRTRHAAPGLLLTALAFGLCLLAGFAPGIAAVHADAIGLAFGVLAGLLALSDAIAGVASPQASPWGQPLALLLLAALLLGFYADDFLLLWLAVAAAVLAHNLATPAASPAVPAFSLILCFAGTVFAYAAAVPAMGQGLLAAGFSSVGSATVPLYASLLGLGFVLLLIGYGSLALLPTAGPPLTRLLPALALLALLRFRHLVLPDAFGPVLLTVAGCLTLYLAALRLLLADEPAGPAALGHAGIVATAFGLGGAAASMAGILHLILAVLGLAALDYAPAAPRWTRAASLFALSGAPPSFLFVSIFLLLGAAARQSILVVLILGLGIALFSAGLLRHAQAAMPAAPPKRVRPDLAALLSGAQLGLGLLTAYAMPASLLAALSAAAASLA